MSEIAGRTSILVGGDFLAKHQGGSGVLPGGVPGVLPRRRPGLLRRMRPGSVLVDIAIDGVAVLTSINLAYGQLTHAAVADAHGLVSLSAESTLR
jgi:alanine dehydrogenase